MKEKKCAPWSKAYNVKDKTNLSLIDMLVFSVIYSHRNAKSEKAFPSMDTIAEGAGLTKKVVAESIKELEAAKLIIIEQKQTGSKLNNYYYFPDYANFNQIPNDFLKSPVYKAKFKAFVIGFRGICISSDLVCKYDVNEIATLLGMTTKTVKKYIDEMKRLNILEENKRNNAFYLNDQTINWRLKVVEEKIAKNTEEIEVLKAQMAEMQKAMLTLMIK